MHMFLGLLIWGSAIHRICRARFDYYLVNRQAPRTVVLSISYSWSSRGPSSLGTVHPLRALSYVKGPWHESCDLQLIRIEVVSSFLLPVSDPSRWAPLGAFIWSEHLEKPPFGCDLQEGRVWAELSKWLISEPQRNKISIVSQLLQYGFQLPKAVFLWSDHKSDCTFFIFNFFGVHGKLEIFLNLLSHPLTHILVLLNEDLCNLGSFSLYNFLSQVPGVLLLKIWNTNLSWLLIIILAFNLYHIYKYLSSIRGVWSVLIGWLWQVQNQFEELALWSEDHFLVFLGRQVNSQTTWCL